MNLGNRPPEDSLDHCTREDGGIAIELFTRSNRLDLELRGRLGNGRLGLLPGFREQCGLTLERDPPLLLHLSVQVSARFARPGFEFGRGSTSLR